MTILGRRYLVGRILVQTSDQTSPTKQHLKNIFSATSSELISGKIPQSELNFHEKFLKICHLEFTLNYVKLVLSDDTSLNYLD